MKIRKLINEFLNEFGYEKDETIEGIILYGSYQTRTNNKDSDVDLIIIYSTESNIEPIKEYKRYKKYSFENYERTLENLYKRIDKDYINYEDTMLSAIGYGEIIKDKNGKIKELQDYTLQKYEKGLPKFSREEVIYGAKSIQKSIECLEKMKIEDSPYYKMFFSLVLDKIRDYNNKKNGFSNMSISKVYRLYTDRTMQEVQHKFMPEEYFIKLYLKCLKTFKYEDIYKLFTYITKDIGENIDFNNIKLKIGERNH